MKPFGEEINVVRSKRGKKWPIPEVVDIIKPRFDIWIADYEISDNFLFYLYCYFNVIIFYLVFFSLISSERECGVVYVNNV